jgi:FkbM family methyltransferase
VMSGPLRSLLYRAGRWLYCRARGEVHNDPSRNGEYWLLSQVLESGKETVLFDVGANLGDWSEQALRSARGGVVVHAFEPSPATFRRLTERFRDKPAVRCREAAVAAEPGEVRFYSGGNGNGTNSLSEVSGGMAQVVPAVTIDSCLVENGITDVAMIKVDTEGFDFGVIQGAKAALAAGRIEVLQFEYNWRWLVNHRALRDVFLFRDSVAPAYLLGRLCDGHIEFHHEWHFELDRFFEGNYVLVRRDSRLLTLGSVYCFGASNTPRHR